MEKVSYLEYEATAARIERRFRRLWVAVVVALGVLGLSNGVWFLMMLH